MLISKKAIRARGTWMKLKRINAGLHGSRLFNRPALHTPHLYNPNAGIDAAARSSGATEQPSGIPTKNKHRKFFNIRLPGNQI